MNKRKLIKRLSVSILCALMIVIISPITTFAYVRTQEFLDRKYELIDQGYDGDVIFDQLYEEFDHVDGPNGTGGIDGLKLDGTPLTDHDYEATSETTATCVTPASITFTCTVCGAEEVEEKEGFAEHIYIASNDSHDATCEKKGT